MFHISDNCLYFGDSKLAEKTSEAKTTTFTNLEAYFWRFKEVGKYVIEILEEEKKQSTLVEHIARSLLTVTHYGDGSHTVQFEDKCSTIKSGTSGKDLSRQIIAFFKKVIASYPDIINNHII